MAQHIVTVRQVFYRQVIVAVPDYDTDNPWKHEDAAVEVAMVAVGQQQGFYEPDARIKGVDGRRSDLAWQAGDDVEFEFDEQPLDDDAEPLGWWADRGYPVARAVIS